MQDPPLGFRGCERACVERSQLLEEAESNCPRTRRWPIALRPQRGAENPRCSALHRTWHGRAVPRSAGSTGARGLQAQRVSKKRRADRWIDARIETGPQALRATLTPAGMVKLV